MSELKGIEKRYEAKGYPLGFESIPTPEFPESSGSGADTQDKASGQRLVQMAEEVASSVDIEFQKLSSIQRKFLTHYRCEHCGLVPLYSMRFQRRRYRCGICGTAVQLGKRGKYGRLRSLIAMKLLNEAGLQEVIPR